MADTNVVVLEGRLVEDPQLQYTSTGTARTKFRLASDQSYEKDGEKKGDVCFVNVCVWAGLAEAVAGHRKKGDKVSITGRLRTFDYAGDDGAKKYGWEVVASSVSFGARSRQNSEAGGAGDEGEDESGYNPFGG